MKTTNDLKEIEVLLESIAAKNTKQAIAGKRLIEVNRGKLQIVKFSEFIGEMKKAGIASPGDYVTCASLLQTIAKRVLPKYEKMIMSLTHRSHENHQ